MCTAKNWLPQVLHNTFRNFDNFSGPSVVPLTQGYWLIVYRFGRVEFEHQTLKNRKVYYERSTLILIQEIKTPPEQYDRHKLSTPSCPNWKTLYITKFGQKLERKDPQSGYYVYLHWEHLSKNYYCCYFDDVALLITLRNQQDRHLKTLLPNVRSFFEGDAGSWRRCCHPAINLTTL